MKLKTTRKVTWLVALVLMGTSVPTMAQVNSSETTVGKGKEWDSHVLAPYVDVEDRSLYDLVKMTQETAISRYNLGFMVANEKGELVWLEDRLTREYRDLNKDVATTLKGLRAIGADGKVCFGGPLGMPLYTVEKDTTKLVKAYKEVIDTYQLTAVDFYIPGGDFTREEVRAIKRNIDAIKTLEDQYPELEIWITFETDYKGMDASVKECINYIEEKDVDQEGINFAITQYKNPYTKDIKPASVSTMTIAETMYSEMKEIFEDVEEDDLWDQMGITVTIGENSFNELFKTQDAEEVAKYAQDKGLGYVGYYLVGEDTEDYAYGDAFAKYLVEDEDKEPTDPSKPEQGIYKGHWRAGMSYEVGAIVKFQNNYFICTQAHTSTGGWQPSKAPALWDRVPGDMDDLEDLFDKDHDDDDDNDDEDDDDLDLEDILNAHGKKWAPQVKYKKGDVVLYKGKWYSCVQQHTAHDETWTPDQVPALWDLMDVDDEEDDED